MQDEHRTQERMALIAHRIGQAAVQVPSITATYMGPGEEYPPVRELTVVFQDGQEFHVQIQEGACERAQNGREYR